MFKRIQKRCLSCPPPSHTTDREMPHAEFTFCGCHTLGMLLQTYAQRDEDVSFVAYKVEEGTVHLKVATCTEDVPSVMRRVVGVIDDALYSLL